MRTTATIAATVMALIAVPLSTGAQAKTVKTASSPSATPTPTPTPTSPYLFAQPKDIVSPAPRQHPASVDVIAYVKSQLGSNYKLGAVGPSAYDCSGLMVTAWQQVGVGLPRTSGQQYLATIHINLKDIQPGDLVFFGKAGSRHVAIYVGNNLVIDAASKERGVVFSDLRWSWYVKNFAGVGRIPAP